jgi:two-component system, NtrC family, nitrogen regulation sensor histidine kinase NtrY
MSLGRENKRAIGHSATYFLIGVAAVFPWVAIILYEHICAPLSTPAIQALAYVLGIYTLIALGLLWKKSHSQFNSLANLVRAIRHGDYTQRAHVSGGRDPVEMLKDEINLLADELQQNRLAQMEDVFLLHNLIDKLEIPVFVLDEKFRLTLANPAFGRLFEKPIADMIGAHVSDLCLRILPERGDESPHWLEFPRRASRYMIHRTEFRQAGRVRHLVLLTDLKNPLREEERTAWKRLIRVMGHELNNSLTPIISLSKSLKNRLPQSGMAEEKAGAFAEALDVVSSRAERLNHFIQDYSRLAKLPDPAREPVPLLALLQRVAKLEGPDLIDIIPGSDCVLNVDPAQVENMLINVVKNAIEATEPDKGKVSIGWKRESTEVTIWIDDCGAGLASNENLFVPFFSTKQGGSGIGLVLSREIAEANGGSIGLVNRPEGGCRATIVLPLIVSN